MEEGNDAEWIVSRKIVVKSLTRHFAPWKSRFFVLDRAQALLGVRSSSNDALLVISLSSQSLSVQRHEYSVDDQYLLTVKYRDEESPTSKEIVMKFESIGHLTYWEKALQSAAANVKAVTATSTRALFNSFLEYVNEQAQLQRIVNEEPEGGAQYYSDAAPNNDAHMLTDDAVDSLCSSFISTCEQPQHHSKHQNPEQRAAGATTVSACDKLAFSSNLETDSLGSRIHLRPLNVPHMRILLIAVGTRGDMQPFVQLGLRLLQDGHRVRLATHACFREYVAGKGLEFYPLAGDPLKLSEFMVKTQGFVIPTTPELMLEAPIYHQMVVDMMYSCWGACVEPDPQDPAARPFVADAIISNPVSYAHIHCAEALGVPLHLMFPQPWTPTKAFPHPLSCLSYQQGWSAENFISYQLVDSMLWLSFERQINAFRVNILGLEPLRVGEGGWNHLNVMKVPFVKMWSPSFVPKPKDWPSYVDVVGTFFDALPKPLIHNEQSEQRAPIASDTKTTTPMLEVHYTAPADLTRFLAAGDTPIFVGFGSMVIKDLEALISLFLEGAALAGVRIIVQVGWSSIKPERFLELALQAQLKASIVRETEALHDHMASSIIFPSNKPPVGGNKIGGGGGATAGGTRVGAANSVADLAMSMRSVQSTSTVDSNDGGDDEGANGSEGEEHDIPDESTLDGERVSSGTRDSESAKLYLSSITAGSVANSAYRTNSSDKSDAAVPFDASPISSPARIPSVDRKRPSDGECDSTAADGGKSGLGNWLIGAAMNLSKSFQPSNQSASSTQGQRHIARMVASEDGAENDISACWDEVEEAADAWSAAKDAFFMGPCPHDWLFQRVAGVVHHGGAGTTAAGLRFGCPTWICPFFGDQHFWGEMVHRRGVGPRPCPIGALTLPVVADSLAALRDDTIRRSAAALAESMHQEDGVEGACAAFYKHLPVENMICDVSIFRGEYRLAQVYCQDCGFKMCNEVSQQLHADPSLHMQDHRIGPCCYKDWTRHGPHSAAEGLLQGLGGLVHELKEGVSDILYDPVKGIYTQGISGAAAGLSTGLNSLLSRPLAGGSVLLNKVKEGIRASLASNMHYRVKTSPDDPRSPGSSYTQGDKEGAVHNSDDTGVSPTVPKSHQSSHTLGFKLFLAELSPVMASTLADEPIGTRTNKACPILRCSPAAQDSPVSPRGMAPTGNLLDQSALERSIRSTASQDSSAFYGNKASSDAGGLAGADDNDIDSDGDDSVYYEEENIPFLLYSSDTQQAHPLKQPSSSQVALSCSTPSTGSITITGGGQEGHQQSNCEGTAGGTFTSTSTSPPDSLDSVPSAPRAPSERVPSSTPPPTSDCAPASESNTAAVAAPKTLSLEEGVTQRKGKGRKVQVEAPSVRDAFQQALLAHKLFRELGATNGRFIAPREFSKVLQRAAFRDTAVTAVEAERAEETTFSAPAPEHSSPLQAYAGSKKFGGINETSTNALIQTIAHGKRYVDFVDFSMIYMELTELAEEEC